MSVGVQLAGGGAAVPLLESHGESCTQPQASRQSIGREAGCSATRRAMLRPGSPGSPPQPQEQRSVGSDPLPSPQTLPAPAPAKKQRKASFVPARRGSVVHSVVRVREKPTRYAFPATPLHASATFVLRMDAPVDASIYERARDAVLRLLEHWSLDYLAALWALCVASWGVYIGVLYIGLHGHGTQEEVESHLIMCFHVETALFSYMNALTAPWRLANAVELWCGARPPAAGLDWYGRSTAAIWFWIAPARRKTIVALLLASAALHYASQGCRLVWRSYEAANSLPGVVPINATFALSIVCGVAAGALQGHEEGQLRKRTDLRFPPSPLQYLQAAIKAWRSGGGASAPSAAARTSPADGASPEGAGGRGPAGQQRRGSLIKAIKEQSAAFEHDARKHDREWRWLGTNQGTVRENRKTNAVNKSFKLKRAMTGRWSLGGGENGRKSSITPNERTSIAPAPVCAVNGKQMSRQARQAVYA